MEENAFVRHVRQYHIDREEYLAIVADTPHLYAFYNGCQSFVTNSIQLSPETGMMTIAGRGIPVPGRQPELSATLLEVGELGSSGWCEFFAQFQGPTWTSAEPPTHQAIEVFQPLSARWSQQGLRMRFFIKHPSFREWSYFQQIEPYLISEELSSSPHSFYGSQSPRFSTEVHRTVFMARQLGFYSNPRTTSLREIAERRGLSHTMVGRHLREAHATLIEFYLTQNLE
ncbi:MAG: helix-turn-helix domain-containing protein [Poseidonia sp.]